MDQQLPIKGGYDSFIKHATIVETKKSILKQRFKTENCPQTPPKSQTQGLISICRFDYKGVPIQQGQPYSVSIKKDVVVCRRGSGGLQSLIPIMKPRNMMYIGDFKFVQVEEIVEQQEKVGILKTLESPEKTIALSQNISTLPYFGRSKEDQLIDEQKKVKKNKKISCCWF